MKRAILFVMFAALCGAQTIVNGGRDYKGTLKASGSVSGVDFSGAGGTAPVKAGTSGTRPTACTQGQIYFATDVAAGQNLYFCTVTGAPGTWTQMSGNAATAITAGVGAPGATARLPPYISIRPTRISGIAERQIRGRSRRQIRAGFRQWRARTRGPVPIRCPAGN